MRKYKSIWQAIALIAVVAVLVVTATASFAAPRPPTSEIRGVWLTNVDSDVLFSQSALRKAIDRLANLRFNTIYPTVWQGGYTLYPSKVTEETYGVSVDPTPGLSGRDMLAEAIEEGHSRGMTVIPWFEYGFLTPADSELARVHPDWLTQRYDGVVAEQLHTRQISWLNPFNPEVQDFIIAMVVEAVKNYDVDGVQFDDHFGLPSDYGYDPLTVRMFEDSLRGFELSESVRAQYWTRWRLDRLTEFVDRLHAAVKSVKPDCIFSLSPNPFLFSHTEYLQDWFAWQQAGLIDELVVQLYRSDMRAFKRELNRPELAMARRNTPIAIGILTGLRTRSMPMSTVAAQVREARRQGFAGVSYFFYESIWKWGNESRWHRDAQLRELFASPVTRRPLTSADRSETDENGRFADL